MAPERYVFLYALAIFPIISNDINHVYLAFRQRFRRNLAVLAASLLVTLLVLGEVLLTGRLDGLNEGECLISHILCVAGIHYRDGVALYRVRKVPLELCSSLLTFGNEN